MVRTRFAPSPTGYLHVGGLRTALYAYLFAKKNNGTFILRIEDTDQERFVEGALENLIRTLNWAGLHYQEGPNEDGSETGEKGSYIQSKRTKIYIEHAEKLITLGHAYRCFCTKERLDEMREKQSKSGQATMYDRQCLNLPSSTIEENLKANIPFVIRQKMPFELIKFDDIIRGKVKFDGRKIDDQILVKSDGYPTYHLANVVDDHLMEVTHVIRGEEWLPSTPKHLALYQSFGWEPPQFAHLPLLLNADRTKLSKRQGDVAVEDYIKKGYLKEAILNFIAFLGWNPGAGEEREIFTLEELTEVFSLEQVHKAGAVFNLEKLDWFNWRWQKHNHNEKLFSLAKQIDPAVKIDEPKKNSFQFNFSTPEQEEEFMHKRGQLLAEISAISVSENNLLKALVTIEEKIIKNPRETQENLECFTTLLDYNKELLTHQKMGVDFEVALNSLKNSETALEKVEEWRLNSIQKSLIETVNQLQLKNGQLLWPLRAALSGCEFSPGAFEMAWALGKEETLKRVQIAIKKLL